MFTFLRMNDMHAMRKYAVERSIYTGLSAILIDRNIVDSKRKGDIKVKRMLLANRHLSKHAHTTLKCFLL